MRLRWTLYAADDLEDIYNYLLRHRPELARSTVLRIHLELKQLRRFPNIGRASLKEGILELVLDPLPYICTYRLEETAVILLRIQHKAQDRSANIR